MKRARAVLLAALAGAAAASFGVAPSAMAQPRPKPAPKLTKTPKLVQFVEADFPEAERAQGKTASVVMEIAISAAGTVDDAVVVQSGGAAFDAAALAAVRRFVFEPAEIDGAKAPVKITYRYTFTLKAEVPTTAAFDGVVRTRGTKKPLAKLTLQIEGGPRVVTDEAGRFHVDAVPPGKRGISIEGEKITALRTEETFEAGKKLEATYEIQEQEEPTPGGAPADDVEVVVTLPPLRKQVVSTEVAAEQGRKVPGAAGDVLKVVENMPGVARATAGSGALVVWGSAPQDTRVYVDGVRVPSLYHYGGLRSVVHTDLVQSVELAPGGYGAAYGGGLGGLVTVQLRPMDTEGFHGSIAADVFDAAATTRASVSNWRFVIAARKSWLDRLLPAITSKNISSLFPVPSYADGQARAAYIVDKRTSVEAGALLSSDSTSSTTPNADPALRETQTTTLGWTRVYARYRHETDAGGVVIVTPSFGTEASSLVSQFGSTPTDLEIDTKVFALRATWRGHPLEHVVATLGLDAEVDDRAVHRFGSVTLPAREGDVRVFGEAPTGQLNADDYTVVSADIAPYVEGDIALAEDKLHVLPGLRFDPYVLAPSRLTPVVGSTPSIGGFTSEPLFEPRLAATYDATDKARVKLAYGRYHQLPQPEDLSAVFGNPTLETARADHFLAGARLALPLELSAEVTGFYTMSSGLAARSASPTPPLAAALAQTGSGRSYGVQVLIRKELSHGVFGWVGYTLSRAERQDQPNGRWRLFDYDQTHVLTTLVSWAIGKGFEVGARLRAATGFPRTPLAGSYFDARTGTWQPIFGVQNTIRIPAFIALDLRASKTWKLGKTELEAYLDVQNVTNRQNPEEIVYDQTYSNKAYITGLPILPSLGLRFAW